MTRPNVLERWAVPGFGLLLGVAMLVAYGVDGNWAAGAACAAILAAYGLVLVLGRGRSETIAVLGGDTKDERRRSIDRDATVVTSYVLLVVIIGAFLWEVAQGRDGEPWSQLGAIGGAAYVLAVLVLRRVR